MEIWKEEMTDIVLIQPPIEDFYFTFKRSIPYGLAGIAATLIRAGHTVEIIDALAVKKSVVMPYPREMNFLESFYGEPDISHFSLFHQYRHYGYSFEHLGSKVRDKKPFMVGISSLFTPYADMALKTAQMVKKFYPRAVVVLGGHHPTRFPRWTMETPHVDFVLRGEGEAGMAMLAGRIKSSPELFIRTAQGGHVTSQGEELFEKIPGIVFRTAGKKLRTLPPAWVEDLGSLPLPALNLVNGKFYGRHGRGSAVVVAGRGCPLPCTYCSVGASSRHARFRLRPVARVLDEIQYGMAHHDVGFIDFEDENFTLNRKWCRSLLQGIYDLGQNKRHRYGPSEADHHPHGADKACPCMTGKKSDNNDAVAPERVELRAMNGLYPPSLDDELVGLMKRAGFQALNLSLGSTSASQLAAFRRPDVRAAHDNALMLAKKHGLTAVSYLIAGAPGQDAQQSVQDLLFLAPRRTLAGLSIYYPAPGSVDYERCREKDILPAHFSLMRSTALPVEDTTTRLESVTLLRLARILNFIKYLKDREIPLPPPVRHLEKTRRPDPEHRLECSLKLLQGFLHDAEIRGITPHGKVFNHTIDITLSRKFATGLSKIDVQGTI